MDRELIKTFRDIANYNNYCFDNYSNVEGKNKWNCICSAMDWIDVAVNDIDFYPETPLFGHSPSATINVMTLLMKIALIKEGIEQLHRAIFNTNEIYLKKDNTVWGETLFGDTDNENFEGIRACFCAHPINLKATKLDKGKRFASWSFQGIDGFEVILYPSLVAEDDIFVKVSFEQLKQYAELRYSYLKELCDYLEKKIQEDQEEDE